MSVSTRNSPKRKRKSSTQADESNKRASHRKVDKQDSQQDPQLQGFWQRFTNSTTALGTTSAVLLFLSFPPVGIWPLAWLAPMGWVWLIRKSELAAPLVEKNQEKRSRLARLVAFWKRPYPTIWLSGFAFWMGVLHWLRLPHWGTSVGWVALCFYFAFYIPLFVGLARVLVHQWRVSVVLAAPVIWTAMEFIRAYMLTGFSMAELGHSQHHWNWLIQIADMGGSFAVSFVVMLVCASVARMLPLAVDRTDKQQTSWTWWPLIPAAATVAGVLAYGGWRTSQNGVDPDRSLRVALIQSSFDTEFRVIEGRDQDIMATYDRLTKQAVFNSSEPIDLVVWPESMFRIPHVTAEPDATVPPEFDSEAGFRQQLEFHQQSEFRASLEAQLNSYGQAAFLAGLPRVHYTSSGMEKYNSAVFAQLNPAEVGAQAAPFAIYDKMHAVPFGEYVPLARYVPWVYNFLPLSGGIEEGAAPQLFEVDGVTFSPSICFESIQSHHIRNAVVQLRQSSTEPDLLVNVTNDGWFWGSSELDLHLICAKFRAVECRKPFLVAANTGISAVIDGNGNVLERGPKRGDAVIVRDVSPDPRQSWYLRNGPWLAWVCLTLSCVAAMAGIGKRLLGDKQPSDDSPAA